MALYFVNVNTSYSCLGTITCPSILRLPHHPGTIIFSRFLLVRARREKNLDASFGSAACSFHRDISNRGPLWAIRKPLAPRVAHQGLFRGSQDPFSQATTKAPTETRPCARIAACSWCPMEVAASASTAGAQAVALEKKGNWVDVRQRQHKRANLLLHCKHACANAF
jgi:hypothetical protein